MGGIIYIIIVGFVAGILARILSPGPNNPSGFILTTVLGIAGAFLATWFGHIIGHYGPDQGAGFITATIGAIVV
ncbi:MAG: GlsB/YeaQ/YmgE family stress response membrane protein, partial [Bradyrhizobium sp.]